MIVVEIDLDQRSLRIVRKCKAHAAVAGLQNPSFGQLGIQAEVWSLCWSPCGKFLATCSEDQSTRVWRSTDLSLIKVLTGHTLAVTSVDWQVLGSGQEVLVSAADDRTVRLYDGPTLELLHVLDTTELFGWHTLTYLAVEAGGRRLTVVTQHGYVVTWAVDGTPTRLAQARIHSGSAEGLVWCSASGLLASVSGDTGVVVMRLRD